MQPIPVFWKLCLSSLYRYFSYFEFGEYFLKNDKHSSIRALKK